MGALCRIAAVAVAGATLYEAGLVHGLVQMRPSREGALFVTLAIAAAVVLLAVALLGTGRGEATARPPERYRLPSRAAWAFVAVMAMVGLAWLGGVPAPAVHDGTPYHNDAIALNECAAGLVLEGRNPYARLDLFACYGERGLGPDRTTPLARGLLGGVEIYPSEEQLDEVWAIRSREGRPPPEFVWRPSYPALSILPLVPFAAFGWDTNALYIGCLLAAMALVIARAAPGLRPFVLTGMLAAASLTAFTVGGSADPLYALPLAAAWLWRERRWSAIALGASMSVKQLSWPFVPFYLIQVVATHGAGEAARRLALAAGVFAVTNLPFVIWDAPAWLAGILTPVAEPMFPRGAGLVFLATNGALPLLPSSAYLALEVLAAVAALALAWRARRSSPELGVVLAMVPLFFAWRSLFSYFYLLPLFAFAGIARMPTGDLAPEAARAAGAFTFLAEPAAGRR